MTWITDEFGNRTFTHANWVVQIWASHYGWASRISIDSPHRDNDVEINEEGIWVNGESPGGWEGSGPNAFTIPWAVIEAIIEAREIVASHMTCVPR